jgi:hypothetical protein
LASAFPRRQAPSSTVALTGVTARPSQKYLQGGTSHDQPTTSPSSMLSMIRDPRAGEWTSSETLPCRIT